MTRTDPTDAPPRGLLRTAISIRDICAELAEIGLFDISRGDRFVAQMLDRIERRS